MKLKIFPQVIQRLALARAIYFNTDIIILDEPTSALDYYAEKQFNKLLTSLKRVKDTCIISHKSKTLTSCDKIYELKVKNELLKNRFPFFAKFFT